MKFSIHFHGNTYSVKKPHPDAFKELYRYKNLVSGKAERIDRWVLEINSIAGLMLLKRSCGYFIIVPSIDIWDDLDMIIIYGKDRPDII